jgi:hypothetical protein
MTAIKKFLRLAACLGVLGVLADAGDLHIYLGTPQYPEPWGAGSVSDDGGLMHPVVTDPVGEVTYGVWAEIEVDWGAGTWDVWNGIGVHYMTTGGVTVVDSVMNNDSHAPCGWACRWEDSSDFGGADGFFLVAVTRYGLGGMLPPDFGVYPPDTYSYVPTMGSGPLKYWLGNITLACDAPGELYLGVGTGGIFRQGGSAATDLIYFGSAEGMRGDAFAEFPTVPLLTCIPEPASLLLLALAGMVLRRR